jgi:branched-chain amino acid transport system substrate-binding protein
MKVTKNWMGILAAIAACALLVSACGGDDDSSSNASKDDSSAAATSTPDASAALGAENKATGSPITVGLLNLESGPVTFPEYRQAAEAAVKYINDYKGGIGGHPVQLEACATDGQPATSARCAGQIADKKPAFILGGADTGAPGAFAVWKRKNLAYIGGVPFTPVESNAGNAVTFISIVVADNAAAVTYAKEKLGVKKASIIQTSDTQGKFTGSIIANVMKNVGIEAKVVNVAPDQADLSSAAASAIENSPDMVYDETPNACPAALKALKSVGFTGKLMGIDPCTSPPALKAAGDAAEGLYFAQPFTSIDADDDDAKLAAAVLQKYAPKDLALNTIALAGLGSVMNLQATLSHLDESKLNTAGILGAFKSGSDHPNFLAHPYTCDGKQVPAQAAVCNSYQLIKQVKGSKITTASDWVTGASNYKPPAP